MQAKNESYLKNCYTEYSDQELIAHIIGGAYQKAERTAERLLQHFGGLKKLNKEGCLSPVIFFIGKLLNEGLLGDFIKHA